MIQIGGIGQAVVLVQHGFTHHECNVDCWAVKPIEGGGREVLVNIVHCRDDHHKVWRGTREKEGGVFEDLVGSKWEAESESGVASLATHSTHLQSIPHLPDDHPVFTAQLVFPQSVCLILRHQVERFLMLKCKVQHLEC